MLQTGSYLSQQLIKGKSNFYLGQHPLCHKLQSNSHDFFSIKYEQEKKKTTLYVPRCHHHGMNPLAVNDLILTLRLQRPNQLAEAFQRKISLKKERRPKFKVKVIELLRADLKQTAELFFGSVSEIIVNLQCFQDDSLSAEYCL